MYVKDRLRRSMMFVPGNNPGMIRDAHIYGADSTWRTPWPIPRRTPPVFWCITP